MKILVVNIGSTSLKYKLWAMADERALAQGSVERIGDRGSLFCSEVTGQDVVEREIEAPDHLSAIQEMMSALIDPVRGPLASMDELGGIGFKTVHAGYLSGAMLVTEEVLAAMERYRRAAPAHNSAYVGAIRVFQDSMPGVPLVAAFETAFHSTMPDYAYICSVPYEWYEDYGVRRYGFHGASFRYIAERTPLLLGRSLNGLRLVACHLGGSSSIAAILSGKSVDTSMGFSPQSGVPMGSRCGDIDPFMIPYVMDRTGCTLDEVFDMLATRSGLLGISGASADVRDLEALAADGHQRAALALGALAYQVKKYVGAYAAALGGLDALVFSGGIGQNAPSIRAEVCRGLEFLGVRLDKRRNADYRSGEALVSETDRPVAVLVVPTNEELIVARETAKVLSVNSNG